jgi:hypothetical protein
VKTEAKEETGPEIEAKKAANAEWQAPPKPAKTVKLTVHKPEGDPSEDIFLAVNFRSYQIKYGEQVEVPEDVVEALEATNMTTIIQDPVTEKMRATTRPRFAFSTKAA